MKKSYRILSFIICIIILSSVASSNVRKDDTNIKIILNYECHYGQCNAIAKSTGQRCLHCVSNPGDLYCWQHR